MSTYPNSILPVPSSIPSIVWPTVPTPMAAQVMSQLAYFSISEKMAREQVREYQFLQLWEVIKFARQTVPYYRKAYAQLPEIRSAAELKQYWENIPLLTRENLQTAKQDIFAETPLATHEPSELMTSTGSTGTPVTVKGNVATQFFWNALTLRDHLWHKHDFNHTYAVIRYTEHKEALPPQGATFDSWGPATFRLMPTGKCHHLTICSTEEEVAWLRKVNPHYLNCNPSTLRELVQYFSIHSDVPSNLIKIHTNSEIVEPELRRLVKEVMGVDLIDTYSARELGYIALQCSEKEHYHIQSENLFVEILNEKLQPCEIGEPGLVVATALHNFASPLIRYVVGDYAIPGDACVCGRTLPVLERVLGRQRNILKLPDGRKIWPSFMSNGVRVMDLFPGGQFQVVQKTLTDIHLNLARIRPFSVEREAEIKLQLQTIFGYPFHFVLNYLEKIERGPGGKFEDFRCEVL